VQKLEYCAYEQLMLKTAPFPRDIAAGDLKVEGHSCISIAEILGNSRPAVLR
jgi:hypothetical protein